MSVNTVINTNCSDLESRYLVFFYQSLILGKYARDNFLPLPYCAPQVFKSVYLPPLKLNSNFFSKLTKIPDELELTDYPPLSDFGIDFTPTKSPFQLDPKPFLNKLNNFLDPGLLSKIKSISILFTPYGSRGSFSCFPNNNHFDIYLTHRIDFPIQNLHHSLLQAIVLSNQEGTNRDIGSIAYYQRLGVLDFLEKSSVLKSDLVYTPHPATTQHQLDSAAYIQKMGLALTPSKLTSYYHSLTLAEKSLYDLLAKNANTIVSFDDCAQALWGNQTDEKFSLQTLAKHLQHLRDKAKSAGIYKDIFFTFRRQGYMYRI